MLFRFIRPLAKPLWRFTHSQPSPSKEALLSLDYTFQTLLPNFMKGQLTPIFQRMTPDVILEDKIYGYEIKGVPSLNLHLLKVRSYFRYKSPFCLMEYKGAVIYDGEHVMTLLWKLSRLRSSFLRYFPAFVTGQKQEMITVEGALDVYVNPEGNVFKMVNRQLREADVTAAEEMARLKKEAIEKDVQSQPQGQ